MVAVSHQAGRKEEGVSGDGRRGGGGGAGNLWWRPKKQKSRKDIKSACSVLFVRRKTTSGQLQYCTYRISFSSNPPAPSGYSTLTTPIYNSRVAAV